MTNRPARRRQVRLVFDVVLAAAGVGVAVWRLSTVDRVAVRPVSAPWLLAAVASAVISLVLYGELHRRLLWGAGARVPGRTVQAVNFAGNAIAQTVPSAGSTVGVAYQVAALRARGADTAVALWSSTVAALLAGGVLLVLAPLVSAATGFLGWPAAAALSVAVGVLCLLVWRLIRKPKALHGIARRIVVLGRHLPVIRGQQWVTANPNPLETLAERLARFRLPPRTWVGALSCALASWGTDFLALAACVAATGYQVPWPAVAVGYLAVQASIGIQLTPAGAGAAETGLLAALIAGGLPGPDAAFAVVLYRAITWIGLSAAGWVVFAVTAALARRRTVV
ncbi:lysylphosphatidylglycerol synthase transmembrane domain-containing protein [Amycolatopsis sp. GM8]|uniref:lysylphosphatidylglycerol synthase transmembrane domain-containing protein n=1 Tax=Amycolatopsis sp. GM8 TaxID=2896530 RepID=UPI001F4790C9|nr:lysylphosphatidylglycerol synthase transmembrane domain-containing protein [Amycolatopsis sp. GM8]